MSAKKLAGMVLIIAHQREVSRTELNKLLFFADAVHLIRKGQQVSGCGYHKKQYGPVPENVDAVRGILLSKGYLEESEREFAEYYRYDYSVPKGKVSLKKVRADFSDHEQAAIDEVTEKLARFNATELSEISHRYEPWKSALPQQKLDMSKVIRDKDLQDWLRGVGISLPPMKSLSKPKKA